MAAIVLQDGAELTPAEFGEFLARQPDLSPKAWPRYVWVTDDLPATATNKVLKRELTTRGLTPGTGVLWRRDPGGNRFYRWRPPVAGNADPRPGVWEEVG